MPITKPSQPRTHLRPSMQAAANRSRIKAKEATRPRQKGVGSKKIESVDMYSDPAQLGNTLPPIPEDPYERQMMIRHLQNQLQNANEALTRRENVDLLVANFDQLLSKVEAGLSRMQRSLKVLIDVAQD